MRSRPLTWSILGITPLIATGSIFCSPGVAQTSGQTTQIVNTPQAKAAEDGIRKKEQEIKDQLQAQTTEYAKLFAARDAKSIVQMWSPEGTYMDGQGRVFVGRDQIERVFQEFFKSDPTSRVKVLIGSVQLVGENRVVERGTGQLLNEKGELIAQDKYLSVNRLVDGKWMIDQFVEFPAEWQPQSLTQLDWLKGSWQADDMKLTNSLNADGHYLISTFSSLKGEHAPDLMITSINPQNGRLISRIFDANGGSGEASWSLTNGQWYVNAVRTEPDGAMVAMTHIIRPETDKSFKWKTVARTVNGATIPDTSEVLVTRTSSGN